MSGPFWQIRQGHAIDELRKLDAETIDTCISSPPYFGHRSYGNFSQAWGGDPACDHTWVDESTVRKGSTNGRGDLGSTLGSTDAQKTLQPGKSNDVGATRQYRTDASAACVSCGAWYGELGHERTPELFVEHLVLVFREVRRVLKPTGTCWINIGDSFFGSWGNYGGQNRGKGTQRSITSGSLPSPGWDGRDQERPAASFKHPSLKPKDLIGVPWMLAFALRADGWWLRSDIVWQKPNSLPESVTDRPNRSHEYVFLLSKQDRYFYDHIAVRQAASAASLARVKQATFGSQTGGPKDYGKTGVNSSRSARKTLENFASNPGRNLRDVWAVSTQPYKGSHFAVMPPKLVEPCILAGTSAGGTCPRCGTPFLRVVERPDMADRPLRGSTKTDTERLSLGWGDRPQSAGQAYQDWRNANPDRTTGWLPACSCAGTGDIASAPAVVLDPFAGAGTVGLVALREGRSFIGIELSPEFVEMSRQRIIADNPLFNSASERPIQAPEAA